MVFTPARARGDRSACVSEPPPSNDTGLHWRDQIDRCEAREAWFTRRALTRGLPRARAVSRHRAPGALAAFGERIPLANERVDDTLAAVHVAHAQRSLVADPEVFVAAVHSGARPHDQRNGVQSAE